MENKWSIKYERCVGCGTTEAKHHAKGLCHTCYVLEQQRKIGEQQEFGCENCGRTFTPKFGAVGKVRRFCSHKCSTDWNAGRQRCKYHSREQLLDAAHKAIIAAGIYLPQKELCKRLHVTSNTLLKYNISIIAVHRDVGIRRVNGSAEHISYFILRPLFKTLLSEHMFDDCMSPVGKPLKFDLYSPSAGILIEIDGDHHRWKTRQDVLLRVHEYARIKDKYAEEHGIPMIHIPVTYKQRITLDHLLPYVERYIECKPDEATARAERSSANAKNTSAGTISSEASVK